MASSASSKYPKLQEIDVQEFLPFASKHLEWGDLSGDTVMDVGCGNGNNSTRHIATLFPNFQEIIAIDIISSTIGMAMEHRPHPKIKYRIADIEDSSTLTQWLGKISKVISVNCFTFLANQALAFENVYHLLAPGGEAAILFSLQSCYFDTFIDLIEQTKWKDHFRNVDVVVPESHSKKFDASHYLTILKGIGFQVVLCQDEAKSYLFQSDADCKKFVTSNNMLAGHVPPNKREEFKQAIFETFLKYNPRASSEQPRLHYRVLKVLVRKLETSL